MAISFTAFASEFSQRLLLVVVHNHVERKTIALKHQRQNLTIPTLLLHGMAPRPAKAGAKGLAIDVTTGGFCPSLKSVTKNRMRHMFVAYLPIIGRLLTGESREQYTTDSLLCRFSQWLWTCH